MRDGLFQRTSLINFEFIGQLFQRFHHRHHFLAVRALQVVLRRVDGDPDDPGFYTALIAERVQVLEHFYKYFLKYVFRRKFIFYIRICRSQNVIPIFPHKGFNIVFQFDLQNISDTRYITILQPCCKEVLFCFLQTLDEECAG